MQVTRISLLKLEGSFIAIGIVSALAPVIVTACVAASSGDKKPIVAVTYYPTPTAALNTPIPTEVPPTPKPTDIPPTPIPTKPAAVIIATQEVTSSIGGGEGVSNIKEAVIPSELTDKIAKVNSAITKPGEGFGGINSNGEALVVTDSDTKGKKPFVLQLKTGDQYFVVSPDGLVSQGKFFNISKSGRSETTTSRKDLLPYETFLKSIAPKVEATKEILTNGNYLRRLISDTVKAYPVELTITESGYNIVGADLNYRLIAIDTKGSAQFLMPQKAGLENAEVNKSAFTALRDVFPGIAKVREIYSVRELAGEFGPTLRRGLEAAGWRNVSLNNPNQPQYFKYISQDGTVMVEVDGRVIPTGLFYYDNPWNFLYNSAGNPVPSIGTARYLEIVGTRAQAVQQVLSVR